MYSRLCRGRLCIQLHCHLKTSKVEPSFTRRISSPAMAIKRKRQLWLLLSGLVSCCEIAQVSSNTAKDGRFENWLQYFNNLLKQNNGLYCSLDAEALILSFTEGAGFFVGEVITWADLQVFHALRATESQFPEEWKAAQVPELKAYLTRLRALPQLKEYEEKYARPFAGDSMM